MGFGIFETRPRLTSNPSPSCLSSCILRLQVHLATPSSPDGFYHSKVVLFVRAKSSASKKDGVTQPPEHLQFLRKRPGGFG